MNLGNVLEAQVTFLKAFTPPLSAMGAEDRQSLIGHRKLPDDARWALQEISKASKGLRGPLGGTHEHFSCGFVELQRVAGKHFDACFQGDHWHVESGVEQAFRRAVYPELLNSNITSYMVGKGVGTDVCFRKILDQPTLCEDDFHAVLKQYALTPAQLELLFDFHDQGLEVGLHDQGYENVAPVANSSGGVSFLSIAFSRIRRKKWEVSLCPGWISGGRVLLGGCGQ